MLRGCGPVSVSSVLSVWQLTMSNYEALQGSHDTFTVTHTAIRIPHRENGRNQSGFSLISTRRGRGRESSRGRGFVDFGDQWTFQCQRSKIHPPSEAKRRPT